MDIRNILVRLDGSTRAEAGRLDTMRETERYLDAVTGVSRDRTGPSGETMKRKVVRRG
jgi:hypothetical protein